MNTRNLTAALWYVVFCGIFCMAKDLWKFPAAWKQLDKKMTESQVAGLLGEPVEKETIEPLQVWYYQGAPTWENGRITLRPKTGFVRFKQVMIDGQQTYLLLDWKVPLWREVAAMPAEVNEPTAVPIEPIQPVEPVKEEVVKTEVNQPVIQPVAPAPAPAPEPKTDFSLEGMWSTVVKWFKSIPRIWLIIGGIVIAFIIFAILKPDPRYKIPKKKKEDNSR